MPVRICRSLPSLIFFLLLAGSAAYAADNIPSISAVVDRDTIYIGDRLKYTISVRAKEDIDIKFPDFSDGRIGDFEIKDSGKRSRKNIFGARSAEAWYVVAIYSTGKKNIPPVEIKYKPERSPGWLTVETGEIAINVKSVLPPGATTADADIRDIKGPLNLRSINAWAVILALLALAASAALIKALGSRKRRAVCRTPYDIALIELEEIRALLADQRNIKEFYVRISDCVRRYIENVFSLKAPEMTTEEFLNSMKESGALPEMHKKSLKDFLEACDLVKFARYVPKETEIESVFTTAKSFIDNTRETRHDSI